jgi:ankyrin repeat protein
VNRRDHIGRMPLHVAIMASAKDIACDLIDTGARISPRIVDGRTALHLAVQMDMVAVVRKLLEKSAINAEAAKKAEEDKAKEETVQTKGTACLTPATVGAPFQFWDVLLHGVQYRYL